MACRAGAHFVLVPVMAQGHIIPMVDAARLLASRGAIVSLILTPLNAARIRPAIDLAARDALPIRFVELPFPCAEAGLPPGLESMDLIPAALFPNFFAATEMFCTGESLRGYLRQQMEEEEGEAPPPSCMVCNVCAPYAATVARSLGIPWILFHGHSAFALLCYHNIGADNLYNTVTDDSLPFQVPGMPEGHHAVVVTRSKAPGFFNHPSWDALRDKIREAEAGSHGVLLNSFAGMEGVYITAYEAALGGTKRAWGVGPLFLSNRGVAGGMAARGRPSVNEGLCMSWLDGKPGESVVYVSFGSLTSANTAQLVEIGEGLRAAGAPFVWVIKNPATELRQWLSEFVEKTEGEGLVIEGWAPQAAMLEHAAVGGFVTHCGWNSVTEAAAAGVPMLTWPHFSDQFLNEMLVTELLGVGVPVGIPGPISYADDGSRVLVTRGEVEKGVRRLMAEDEEGKLMRERAKELGKKAAAGMDDSGSSHRSLTELINCFTKLNE